MRTAVTSRSNWIMKVALKTSGSLATVVSALALTAMVVSGGHARADEADAKRLLKAMSDYLAAQKSISFGFDTNYEVVTKDNQKLLLASSGTISLSRPDKVHVTRTGGFANLEM